MPSEEMTTEIEAAVEELEVEGITPDPTPDSALDPTPDPDPEPTGDSDSEPTLDPDPSLDSDSELTGDPVTSPALDNEILERAVSLGIPVADARELGKESLSRIFKAHEEESRQIAEETSRVAQVETVKSKEEPADPFADFPKLDPEVHDEATIAAFEKLRNIAKQQQEQIGNFQARQEDIEYTAQKANRRDTVQWFDGKVSELGEDFVDALGTGGYDTLDQGSAQFAKREMLANQVSVLLAGYEATGQQAPPRDEVFDVAARLVLHDEYQQIGEKKLSGDLKKRASQHIQRAGGQKATGKETPMEEAAREIDEKYFS